MHKSWGNAIEFDDAAERMGVDVMRWMFANARPEDNILFGWHAADEARRQLLVLWNVYAFFVTYAGLAGWAPERGIVAAIEAAGGREAWPALDRWILSRAAGLAAAAGEDLDRYDALDAAREMAAYIDDLSTWYLRRSRDRMRGSADGADASDREAAFATLHAALVAGARVTAPVLPFLSEAMYQNLIVAVDPSLPDSVHLTRWPAAELATLRDEALERGMATVRRAVELARGLRSQAGLRVRQPLGRLWLALPGGDLPERDALLALVADEVNVGEVLLIDDESELVERRVKPLLPRIGKKLGSRIPAVMAAARAGDVEYLPDGSVRLAGVTLAPDEVEILATPRPGTAVAHDEGLVVVIDTTLTDELRAEGDARELQRAIQDLRRDAELALDDTIDVWLGLSDGTRARLEPHLARVAAETLATGLHLSEPPPGIPTVGVDLEAGPIRVGLSRAAGAA